MLPLEGFATMLKLPRTAGTKHSRREGPSQRHDSETGGSPTEVLAGLPVAPPKPSRRAPAPPITVLDGHAQDIVHLLQAGWFGPLNRSKAAALFTPPSSVEEDDTPAPSPRACRGRRRQQQQQQQQGRGRGSDASPSTSSQHSGDSSQQLNGGAPAAAAAQGRQQQQQQQAAQQAAAVQDLPGIGTWAGRYRLFGQQQPATEERQHGGSLVAEAQHQRPRPYAASLLGSGGAVQQDESEQPQNGAHHDDSPVVLRPGGFGGPDGAAPAPPHAHQYGSAEAQEDVWRWRFSRKWATEQKRYYEAGEVPASMVSDDLDAMEFTQACGMGLNLQVMPTSNPRRVVKVPAAGREDEGGLGIENSGSTLSLCQFDVDHSETTLGLLSAEMSPCSSAHGAIAAGRLLGRTSSGLARQHGQPQQQQQTQQQQQQQQQNGHHRSTRERAAPSPRLPSATKSVMSLANRAQELLRRQGAIEQEVQDRWERSCRAGDSWAGRQLKAVSIDMWGRFKYCVLRVSDGAGRTRFIVRGRAGASPATLLEEANAEAAAASRSGGLPAVMVEVVGTGIMEWREDTERELHLVPTTLPGDAALEGSRGASDSPTKAPFLGDVSGLTASLVRQALPCHFRITTASASRAASMAALANRV